MTLLILFLLSLQPIDNSPNLSGKETKCFQFVSKFPLIGNDGKLRRYLYDTVYISYKDDIELFSLPYHFTFTDHSNSSKNFHEIRYIFFARKISERVGFLFHTQEPHKTGWYPYDSIIGQRDFAINGFNFYTSILESNVTLISSQENKNSGTLHELLYAVNKQDTSIKATIELSYTDKIKDVGISLSNHLDSIKNLKLYSAKTTTHSRFMKSHNIIIDEVEISSSLQEVNIADKKDHLEYIEKFKKEKL